jgi:multiple sugar transport system substrate-binding protein
MVFGEPAELRAYQELVRAFEARRPGVSVEVIHIPGQAEYRRRLAADFAGGIPADVLLINYRRYAGFARRGVLQPLGPYLARSSLVKEADFYPEALGPFRWNGQLVGIPQNLSSLVVYYNKALFDRGGVPYPETDWTWEDFLETARALTRDLDGDGRTDQYGLGTEVSLARLAPVIWQNGGELVHPEAPTFLAVTEPPAVEAAEWFVNLRKQYRVVPDLQEERAEESESRFLNGRTAMFLNSRRGVPAYREIRGFDWDVAPLPRGKRRAGILHSDAYFIPTASARKEEAWRFVEFAVSARGQRIVAASGRTVPSLREVAESPVFLSPQAKPASSRIFLEGISQTRAVPVHPFWEEIEGIFSDELKRAFYGETSIHEALIVADQRAGEYLRK